METNTHARKHARTHARTHTHTQTNKQTFNHEIFCHVWFNYTDIKIYLINTVPDLPGFHSSVMPDVDNITSSSATVSWPRATNVSAAFEGHYHYLLWLQAEGEREKNVKRVEQGAGEQRMEVRITELTYNTNYSLRVEPYRELNGERQGGASTGVVTFKTRCIGMLT